MNRNFSDFEWGQRVIGALLWYGTWLASTVIAAGLLMTAWESGDASYHLPVSGPGVVKGGIALFILLPVARVVVMLVAFLRARDLTYAVIAALVLAIIAVSILVEL